MMMPIASLTAALDHARILCIELDAHGTILSFSAACERSLGYAGADVCGRKLWELMAVSEEIAFVKEAFAAPLARFPFGFVDRFRHKNGTERMIAWSATVTTEEPPHIILIGRDLTDHRRMERTVEGQSAWFRLLLEQVPAIVWTVDKDFMITSSTGSGLRGLGLKPGQLEDVSLYEYLHTSDPNDPEVLYVKRALAGETTSHESGRMGRTFQSIIQPLRDDSGVIVGAIALAVDVTDRREMEEKVKRSREELKKAVEREKRARLEAERLSRIKDEFLVTLSHELRTPLVPILGWIELLASGDVDDGGFEEAITNIERNAKAELHLIEDLLDLSRITSNKFVLDFALVNLSEITRTALETMRYMAEAKGVELVLTSDEQTFMVQGDARRLQQVIWNLVGNAIKFTPSGGHIAVSLKRDKDAFVLTVKDDGVGIPREALPHIFERFRQADSSVSRQFGGLGLGLSLVQHIVEAHGGRVEAASEGAGKGATFTVTLPAADQG